MTTDGASPVHHPKVSVVITVHDRFEFLEEAIASVRRQTYRGEVEIVVVDDGSMTPVDAIFRDKVSGVRWLRQDNLGMTAARQAGSDLATGELLAYLDDDDLMLPEAIETQVEFLAANPTVGMACSDIRYLYSSGKVSQSGWYGMFPLLAQLPRRTAAGGAPGWIYPRQSLLRQLLLYEPAYPSTTVIRRDFLARIGGWNVDALPVLDAFDIYFRATCTGEIGLVQSPLVLIRRGHAQATSNLERARVRQTRSLQRWLMSSDPDLRDHGKAVARRFLRLGYTFMRRARLIAGIEHTARGVVVGLAAMIPAPLHLSGLIRDRRAVRGLASDRRGLLAGLCRALDLPIMLRSTERATTSR